MNRDWISIDLRGLRDRVDGPSQPRPSSKDQCVERTPEYCQLDFAPIEGDPFTLARSTCENALRVAQDVAIDDDKLAAFAADLDYQAIREVANGHMGENCDVGPNDFPEARDAANFAVLFGLLQFGHGFRYELHRLCDRGASKTITLGVTTLREGSFDATRLSNVTFEEIRELFGLSRDECLDEFALQLVTVLRQAGRALRGKGVPDFDSFCRRVLDTKQATAGRAATLVRELANTFPAFNDQGWSRNGSRVVFLKKATLAAGELRRLAAQHAQAYREFPDLSRAIAPVDNVIPAVLVFHEVLQLSDVLHSVIHEHRRPLDRGPQEAELRAAALVACERIVHAADHQFTALDLGYYLWLHGKKPEIRQFARHHTKDTIYY